jgi:hypothetical protein
MQFCNNNMSHKTRMGPHFYKMGQDSISHGINLHGTGPDFYKMGWDGISHGTNSYKMGPKIFLRDRMGPDPRGTGHPVRVPRPA